jgi:5-amino-6-(5-phosphoribosylamino)uracil reductase
VADFVTDLRKIHARPHMTVVLAMTADGKIADARRSPARFGSAQDKRHLEAQIAQADGVLFGAGTLRAYGTTLRVTTPELLTQRQQRHQPPQPAHIVCSASGKLERQWAFFQQPVPRWLVTTQVGAAAWMGAPEFERVLIAGGTAVNWPEALAQFAQAGLQRIAVTGGGELVASLLEMGAIDELWLTICPVLLGGRGAPTPVGGLGLEKAEALELLSVEAIGAEVFLHYGRT